jgi:uncharacterized damage-inducible protein DinB
VAVRKMTELETLRTFYRFNSKVRRNYLQLILKLPIEERLKDRGASYPSLQEIFVHTLDGLHAWLEFAPQDRFEEHQQLNGRELTEEQLRAETEAIDAIASRYLGGLREGDLEREMVIHYTNSEGSRVEERFPIGDALWHMVEEELQHRGELNALLWQMDIDPPLGSLDDWNASKRTR